MEITSASAANWPFKTTLYNTVEKLPRPTALAGTGTVHSKQPAQQRKAPPAWALNTLLNSW
jgi:hypothetical protein